MRSRGGWHRGDCRTRNALGGRTELRTRFGLRRIASWLVRRRDSFGRGEARGPYGGRLF